MSRNKFNFNVNIYINDKILMLFTYKDMYGNRIVIHSKLIKKGTRFDCSSKNSRRTKK